MLSKRSALMIIGTLMALETCLILGQVSHNLLYSKKNLPTDICGPGEISEETAYIQAHLWPELWKSMGKHAKLKEKQLWSEEKLHLENARKLRKIYFIDPEDTEFKETIKNARKKLETSAAPAMPCKIIKKKIVGVVHPIKLKQNLRVFWKLMNPQECVWEIRYRIIMKTILQEMVKIHYSTTIWFTSLFLCLKL